MTADTPTTPDLVERLEHEAEIGDHFPEMEDLLSEAAAEIVLLHAQHRADHIEIERLRAAGGIERLRAEVLDAAEIVGAQTLDLKAIGKGRRQVLVDLVDRMTRIADGQILPPHRGFYRRPSVVGNVRSRFGLEALSDDR